MYFAESSLAFKVYFSEVGSFEVCLSEVCEPDFWDITGFARGEACFAFFYDFKNPVVPFTEIACLYAAE
ncbi:MAG TPA: hypothetical protein O0X23_02780 [Methanocorpusculum sp.]|nr:hypothetical protein [Methanocorpusculum sp.]